MSMQVDRINDQRIFWSGNYLNPNSREYRTLEDEASYAVSPTYFLLFPLLNGPKNPCWSNVHFNGLGKGHPFEGKMKSRCVTYIHGYVCLDRFRHGSNLPRECLFVQFRQSLLSHEWESDREHHDDSLG